MHKPPTWCEMVQHERHQLLGEIIDAMIYSGVAVIEVQDLIDKFKNKGYIKSKILFNQTTNHESDQHLPSH